MDAEDRKLLERVLEVSEQNNKMLRAMRRDAVISRVMQILYWVFMIGIAVGVYFLISPYLGDAKETINTLDQVKDLYLSQ
ncbi:MAG: hypothetical protein K0S38_511 [Candidatus Paceibacter sp.]|jgi:hypothetical protein|nr:hypothetical protein [Candidatus Paceibacter sp.]